MRSKGTLAILLVCVVLIGAAAVVWYVHRVRVDRQKLSERVKLLQQRASQGDAQAEYNLSGMYHWGRGVPQDDSQTSYWAQKAADQGFAKAEYVVGNIYFYGWGRSQSYADALVWYRKAADQGLPVAQFAIASIYYHGFGEPQSYTDALAWYKKAADQNYAKAESGIGYLFWCGLGVQKDHAEANRWYRKAASHGDEEAQRWLGLRFYPLEPWAKITHTILLLGSLFLLSGLLSPQRYLRNRNQRRFLYGGALGLFLVGMEIYAHSQYCLFPSAWAAFAYQFIREFLGGIFVTLLVTALLPKGGRALLGISGALLVAISVSLCVITHFNLRVSSAFVWRLAEVDSFPLGMAISAAWYSWRRKKGLEDEGPEAPPEEPEAPEPV